MLRSFARRLFPFDFPRVFSLKYREVRNTRFLAGRAPSPYSPWKFQLNAKRNVLKWAFENGSRLSKGGDAIARSLVSNKNKRFTRYKCTSAKGML